MNTEVILKGIFLISLIAGIVGWWKVRDANELEIIGNILSYLMVTGVGISIFLGLIWVFMG
jgi:hypothetical protein